ncbi:MAG: saccharopine dehydrogenase NADP-binding domain-containing protein [Acidobacteriota bacterium]
MNERWLIYGATGYTGRMLSRRAAARGLKPLLAGRDAARLRRLATSLSLEYRVAHLDDPAALSHLLQGSRLVLNAAGPFVATAGPLVAACLASGAHYLDVTGEPAVFAALARRGEEARRSGVMLLPGAGFVIVASDCLAAHLARRLPGAVRLRLGMARPGFAGRGSLRTIVRQLGPGVHVRRGGRLVLLPWSRMERDFDYGQGQRTSLAVEAVDAVTAYLTTGIPDIEVYLELLPWEKAALLAARLLAGCFHSPWGRAVLRAPVEAFPEGPTPVERRHMRCVVVAEAENRAGQLVSSRLRTPDGYTFTAAAALAAVERVLAGDLKAGFQTPAQAYGADFVLGLDGVTREDLAV